MIESTMDISAEVKGGDQRYRDITLHTFNNDGGSIGIQE